MRGKQWKRAKSRAGNWKETPGRECKGKSRLRISWRNRDEHEDWRTGGNAFAQVSVGKWERIWGWGWGCEVCGVYDEAVRDEMLIM